MACVEADAAVQRARRRRRSRHVAWVASFFLAVLILGGLFLLLRDTQGDQQYLPTLATVVAALVAGVVSAFAFIETPRRMKQIEQALEYTERQISGLWGPLLGKLRLIEALYDELLANLDPRALPREKWQRFKIRLPEQSLDPFEDVGDDRRWRLWREFCDDYLLQQNEDLTSLLSERYAFVGQDPFPDIDQFLAHSVEFKAKYKHLLAQTDEPFEKSKSHLPSMALNAPARHGLKLNVLFPAAFEFHTFHKLKFLQALQRKYRLQLEGRSAEKMVHMWTGIASYHRVLAREPAISDESGRSDSSPSAGVIAHSRGMHSRRRVGARALSWSRSLSRGRWRVS